MVTVEARGPHDDQLQTRNGAKGESQRAVVPLHVASHQQDLRVPGHHVLLAIFKDQFYRVSSKEVVKEWFQKPKSQNLPIKGGGPSVSYWKLPSAKRAKSEFRGQ